MTHPVDAHLVMRLRQFCGYGVMFCKEILSEFPPEEQLDVVKEYESYKRNFWKYTSAMPVDRDLEDEYQAKEEKQRLAEQMARNACVTINFTSESNLNGIKIYVDGNIAFSDNEHRASSVNLNVLPGEHRITIRDYDPFAPDRRESNTVFFNLNDYETIKFTFSIECNEFLLTQVQGAA